MHNFEASASAAGTLLAAADLRALPHLATKTHCIHYITQQPNPSFPSPWVVASMKASVSSCTGFQTPTQA